MGRVHTHQLTTVDEAEHQAHNGQVYTTDYLDDSVDNDASLDILLKNDGINTHLVLAVAVGGDAKVFLYEDTTVSADGTQLTPHNLNRTIEDQSSMSVYHTPTVTTVGTQIKQVFVVGGAGGNSVGSVGAGPARPGTELILKKNTNYLLRITNVAGQAKRIGFDCSFYHNNVD